jgi:hypothetical protein
MKKVCTFLSLLLISGIIFAQSQQVNIVNSNNILPVTKAKAVVDSLHYDGANSTSLYPGNPTPTGYYAFFPAATLAPHATANQYILSVKYYVVGHTSVSNVTLRIYTDTLTSALVYSQAFTPVDGWNNVQLTTPFAIPSTGNLYIGYYMTSTSPSGKAGCDAGTVPNANGNWFQQAHWKHLTAIAPGMNNIWNIRVMIGSPNSPTTTCSPLLWAAGNIPITTTATSGTFTLKNIGAGTVTCSGITGLSSPYTTTLVPANVNLTANATLTFTFSFNPTVAGANNQTVLIATNGGTITIHLTGTGNSSTPVASCTPLIWPAGNVPISTSLPSGTFTLKNTGPGTLTCSAINGLSAPFTTTLVPATVSLATNATKTFTFTYSPTVIGTNNQTAVIVTNGGNISITLSGNGSVGIDEADEKSVGIFPNPVNDILNIIAENIKSVEIYNNIGENVASYGNSHMINISDLSVGTYIVKVITDSKVITRKINIVR